jgi:ssDNA-binding Zn-finger/Zn-ribbon topoisomerase 1
LEVDQILRKLDHHESESDLTKKDHIRSLRQRYQSKIICPKCGSELVERTAKNGPNAGREFLGCENFPRCRYTTSV